MRRALAEPGFIVEALPSREAFVRALGSQTAMGALVETAVSNPPDFARLREVARGVPMVAVGAALAREDALPYLEAGADDVVARTELWKLPVLLQRHARALAAFARLEAVDAERSVLKRLVAAVRQLSVVRTMEDIAREVRQAARALVGADGATFVLKDGDLCHYYDEDAITPLWKGRRFPQSACISGWAMIHKTHAAIPDIYADARIPADAYRPTFVQSLVMVPVRRDDPVAAIGTYWARTKEATEAEIATLQTLADATSVAMENLRLTTGLEAAVRARTASLESTNKELEAFADSVSHDLRNPLGQILGFSELLMPAVHGQPHAEQFAAAIRAGAVRAHELVDDLLRLGLASGAALSCSRVDLSAEARSIISELLARPGAQPFEWQVPNGLVAEGDPGLLRVVLQNLLSNASKYSGKRPRPRIEVAAAPSQPGMRTFLVRDNGAGFDAARAHRLFTPFGRLHSNAEFPGTGIGLATCQRIIHRHHGRIWAEASPGAGATFYFSLPQAWAR